MICICKVKTLLTFGNTKEFSIYMNIYPISKILMMSAITNSDLTFKKVAGCIRSI